VLLVNSDTFFVAPKNFNGFLKCLITIRSAIKDNVVFEQLNLTHVRVHHNQILKNLLWFKVESLRVLDLEFEPFLRGQLIETEVDSLCKLLTEL